MRNVMYALSFIPVVLFSTLLLTGCAGSTKRQAVSHQEEFTSANVYAHSFPGSDRASCEAARRALLSQGYVISEAGASLVKGRKNFQPDSNTHTQIEFHVVCAPDSDGSNSTTVFANAVRDRYSLRKSSDSASVGVGVLGSVSLPFRSSDDSLVKVGSETIPSGQFYKQFFELVESYLDPGPANVDARESASGRREVRPIAPAGE